MAQEPTPTRELRDAVRLLKGLFQGDRDLGLDPPMAASVVERLQSRAPAEDPAGPGQARNLEALRELLGECTRCPLHAGRRRVVFGEGDPRADLVLVGEAPGGDEDRAGRPFVGEAGRLLSRIIGAMGLSRDQVYICNVVKCRPPRNRDPQPPEITACRPFLERQIDLIGPKVICTLGRVAGRELLGRSFSVTADRGRWFEYRGVPVMPTYHPAYLLRNAAAKRPVWEDVKQIMKVLGLKGGSRV